MVNTMLEFRANLIVNSTMCRLCMGYHEDSLNLFVSSATNGAEIWNVIKELLNLEVAVGDGLPDTVCPHCLRKLMEFSEFKEMCIKSASELKNNTMKSSLKNLKEVDSSESLDGEGTYRGDPLDQCESQERAVYNVVCVPLEMGDQVTVKEEVDPDESSVEEGAYRGVNLAENEYQERNVCDTLLTSLELGNLVSFKEEVVSSEEETYMREDLGADELRERTMCNIVSFPFEMEDQGNESSITQNIPEMKEKVLSDWGDGSKGKNPLKIYGHCPPGHSLENNSTDEYQCDQEPVDSHKKLICDWTEYICDHCGFMCSDKYELCVHISGHISNERTLKFEQPDEDISVEGTSLECKKTDKDSKPFKCGICGKEFAQKCNLGRHLTVHNESKQYKCDLCGKNFNQKSHLLTHLFIHTGSKPFKCGTCGKGFNRKSDLLRHSVTHTGAKPFRCGTCGKEFTQKSTLMNHSLIHTGLKPFKCDKCWKVFNRRSSLLRHSVTHSGLTPFKCETCGREFSLRGHLLRHAAVHFGLMPFKCETCGKKFASKTSLEHHLIVHTGKGPFTCKTCGKAFNRKGALMTHSIIHIALLERIKANERSDGIS